MIDEQVDRIRAQVGDGRVICGLSGGVDSAVAALLVHKAVGDQLTCVFVDHGLMRKNEAEQVVETFRDSFGVPLVHVDAEERFLDAARRRSTDPETKRKIIGEEFIRVFEEEARKLDDVRFLVQGTLYSDVIESGGGDRRGDDQVAPQRRRPARRPRVRARRAAADALQGRGPRASAPSSACPSGWSGASRSRARASAIRIIGGEVNEERLDILRDADADPAGGDPRRRALPRALAVLLRAAGRPLGRRPGRRRTYAYPIVIRAVTSDDAMTADWARLPYDLLERVSNRIINEIPGVNRVALDISSKPPATIEWE